MESEATLGYTEFCNGLAAVTTLSKIQKGKTVHRRAQVQKKQDAG